jgi:hypothetical protein
MCSLHGLDVLAGTRSRLTRLRRREEDRIDEIEIALLAHSLQENGTDHSTPPDDAYVHLDSITVTPAE